MKQRDKSHGKEFWRSFEEEVEEAVAALGNAKVRRDVKVLGELSRRPRQIDVIATGEVGGWPMMVIFEAKCYTGSVQIGTIDELVGKGTDVAAQTAVLYAPNGFSAGARARAAGSNSSPLRVGVVDLPVDWPDERVLSGYPKHLAREVASSFSQAGETEFPTTGNYAEFFRGKLPLSR